MDGSIIPITIYFKTKFGLYLNKFPYPISISDISYHING